MENIYIKKFSILFFQFFLSAIEQVLPALKVTVHMGWQCLSL
jgi:hypothetical protein